ncbi:MAG: hypothetical protein JWM57_2998 [Phycisphaerales bacterium]|nr:hypothetical protein [Phycisphaerales bacterium]
MTDLNEILGQLEHVKSVPGGWIARCPSHDDRNPSLSIGQGEGGRILLHCHAGCKTDNVCVALGLKTSHLMNNQPYQKQKAKKYPPQERSALIAGLSRSKGGPLGGAWSYCDTAGVEVMQILRFDLPGDEKVCVPIRHTGAGWVSEKPKTADGLPLYRVGELSVSTAGAVFVCEGEKCVDAARNLGVIALTSAFGSESATKSDWRPLAGREVVVLADQDEAGSGYARDVAGVLLKLTPPAKVRIVNLAHPDGETPSGFDVVDWIDAQDARAPDDLRDDLFRLAAAAPIERRPPIAKLVCMDSIQEREVNWLWPNRIASGKVNALLGDPGCGKSMLTMDLAARVSSGGEWPDGTGRCRRGSVILMSAEDDPEDTIKPRLLKAGADCSRIHILPTLVRDGREQSVTLRDLDAIRDALETVGDARLLVIDPINNYVAGVDAHKDAEVRQLLTPLVQLAAEFDVAVVIVTHLNKGGGTNAVYRAMGSLAFVALSRTAWLFSKDPDSKSRRTLVAVKTNITADQNGLACSIVDGAIHWETGSVEMTASETLVANEIPRTKTGAAIPWLKTLLSDGPLPQTEIEAAGAKSGLSPWSIRKARENLKIVTSKDGFSGPWTWALPS